VPELINAARTSEGLQTHAIPNVSIPNRIKTTAHTCELMEFKPLTKLIGAPVSFCCTEYARARRSFAPQEQLIEEVNCSPDPAVRQPVLNLLISMALSISALRERYKLPQEA
jgi:hypothetical protein